MFDRYKAFLLCPPDKPLRILCREFPEKVGLGIDVSQIGFVEASTAFVQWFEMQQHRLSGGANRHHRISNCIEREQDETPSDSQRDNPG
jgi:hypothetical protein